MFEMMKSVSAEECLSGISVSEWRTRFKEGRGSFQVDMQKDFQNRRIDRSHSTVFGRIKLLSVQMLEEMTDQLGDST
jgi:hypothetical protein